MVTSLLNSKLRNISRLHRVCDEREERIEHDLFIYFGRKERLPRKQKIQITTLGLWVVTQKNKKSASVLPSHSIL